jgi:putative ABC transport system ATP-binding protein
MSIIKLSGVNKFFGTKESRVTAVKDATLEIPQGSFTVILGRSGSGKSTLLNLMAGLDTVSGGEIESSGFNLSHVGKGKLAKYRANIGIIFQFYNLMPNLNTMQNVQLGGWAGGKKTSQQEARDLLESLGLGHRLKTNVKLLSGGEKQRVAIARSLVGSPEILFCDEPTGALDLQSEKDVQDILVKLNREQGKTIVLVTHNPEFQEFATQVVTMSDGSIVSNETKGTRRPLDHKTHAATNSATSSSEEVVKDDYPQEAATQVTDESIVNPTETN